MTIKSATSDTARILQNTTIGEARSHLRRLIDEYAVIGGQNSSGAVLALNPENMYWWYVMDDIRLAHSYLMTEYERHGMMPDEGVGILSERWKQTLRQRNREDVFGRKEK